MEKQMELGPGDIIRVTHVCNSIGFLFKIDDDLVHLCTSSRSDDGRIFSIPRNSIANIIKIEIPEAHTGKTDGKIEMPVTAETQVKEPGKMGELITFPGIAKEDQDPS